MITPDVAVLQEDLRLRRRRLAEALQERVRACRWALNEQRLRLRMSSPRAKVASARQRLDDLMDRALAAASTAIQLRRVAVGGLLQTLRAVGPLAVLERGYAVVRLRATGQVVRSCRQATPGAALEVRVADGAFPARAE